MSYADAEDALVTALSAQFQDVLVCTETPSDLAAHLPCIRVTRFAGASEAVYTFDNPSVDFDCYAATRQAARTLAYEVRTYVRGALLGTTAAGAFFSRARDILGPHWTPYDNTSLRRFTYSAAIRIHSRGT